MLFGLDVWWETVISLLWPNHRTSTPLQCIATRSDYHHSASPHNTGLATHVCDLQGYLYQQRLYSGFQFYSIKPQGIGYFVFRFVHEELTNFLTFLTGESKLSFPGSIEIAGSSRSTLLNGPSLFHGTERTGTGGFFFLDEVPQLSRFRRWKLRMQSVLLSNDISEVTPLPLRILE